MLGRYSLYIRLDFSAICPDFIGFLGVCAYFSTARETINPSDAAPGLLGLIRPIPPADRDE